MQKQRNKRRRLAGALTGVIAITVAAIGLPSQSYAVSEAECAIWLCLPGGFPSGCGAAHSAFIDRITHKPKPKPPLPPFGACAVDAENINYTWGFKQRFRCEDPESELRSGTGGTSCRKSANNEDGYVNTPLIRDEILWTDVPSLGAQHRETNHDWRSTTVHGGHDEGRR